MRVLAALVFFLIAAFGALLGIVYPLAGDAGSREMGRWQAFSAGEFISVEVRLPSDEEQVRVTVEFTAERALDTGRAVVLTMTAASAGSTHIAEAFVLDGIEPRIESPQSQRRVYVLHAPMLYPVGSDPYVFTFGSGEVDVPLASVDLVLVGGIYDVDESVPPIGYGIMAVGVIGFVLSIRRRRENPNSSPPPRWGRG